MCLQNLREIIPHLYNGMILEVVETSLKARVLDESASSLMCVVGLLTLKAVWRHFLSTVMMNICLFVIKHEKGEGFSRFPFYTTFYICYYYISRRYFHVMQIRNRPFRGFWGGAQVIFLWWLVDLESARQGVWGSADSVSISFVVF